jgi:hypothetical protein
MAYVRFADGLSLLVIFCVIAVLARRAFVDAVGSASISRDCNTVGAFASFHPATGRILSVAPVPITVDLTLRTLAFILIVDERLIRRARLQ